MKKYTKIATMSLVGAALMLGAVSGQAQQTNANNNGLAQPFRGVTQAKDSSITVYGQVHLAVENIQTGTAPSINGLGQDGSRLGFTGREKLSNGLEAFYTIETGFAGDAPRTTTTSLGDRSSLVGLRNSWLEVKAGRGKHALINLHDKYQPFMTPWAQMHGSVHEFQGLRVQNTIFTQARPTKELMVAYQYTASEVAGKDATQGARVDWDNGKFAVGAAMFDDNGVGAASNKSTAFAAAYRPTKAWEISTTQSSDTVLGKEVTGKSVYLSHWLKPSVLLAAGYGQKTGAVEMTAVNLGVSYAMSPRTWVHVRYLDQDYTVNTKDRKQYGVSLQHFF